MKIIKRNYIGEPDKLIMIQLAQQLRQETLHVTDLPYRLSSWALDQPANIALWVSEDSQVMAWAVMQTPFWTADYVYIPDPGLGLHRKILEWVDDQASASIHTKYGQPSWFVNVFADQAERRKDLELAGYTNQAELGENAWSKVWMESYGQGEIPGYPLPNGYSMRPLAGVDEVEAYVALHQAVFGTKNMTVEWRQRTLLHPDYLPELDMVIAAPDGRLAAFCIGWLSKTIAGETIGQIEPLGCHADFRRYALGRVVLCETLRRMQQLGVKSIFVETDSYRNTAFRLYESVSFRVIRDVMVYGKDYNQGPI